MAELDDFRYPIGKFNPASVGGPAESAAQIESLRQLPAQLRVALTGLDEAGLDTPYREGGWTVRQVVHHLADSHMNSYLRFKLALTEDWPTIKTYKEGDWAKLADSKAPVEGSLLLIGALHERWAELLKTMTDEDFAKGFNHPENGKQGLGKALAIYEWHGRHHTAHITKLRERNGW